MLALYLYVTKTNYTRTGKGGERETAGELAEAYLCLVCGKKKKNNNKQTRLTMDVTSGELSPLGASHSRH